MPERTAVSGRDDNGELLHDLLIFINQNPDKLDKHLMAIRASAIVDIAFQEGRTQVESEKDALFTCLYGLSLYHSEVVEESSLLNQAGFAGLSSMPQ